MNESYFPNSILRRVGRSEVFFQATVFLIVLGLLVAFYSTRGDGPAHDAILRPRLSVKVKVSEPETWKLMNSNYEIDNHYHLKYFK